MGLNRGQNIIAGSYMLPRADDNKQVHVLRIRRHKKRGEKKREEEEKKEYEGREENKEA
jgi:hypothetical protein